MLSNCKSYSKTQFGGITLIWVTVIVKKTTTFEFEYDNIMCLYVGLCWILENQTKTNTLKIRKYKYVYEPTEIQHSNKNNIDNLMSKKLGFCIISSTQML